MSLHGRNSIGDGFGAGEIEWIVRLTGRSPKFDRQVGEKARVEKLGSTLETNGCFGKRETRRKVKPCCYLLYQSRSAE